jgi:hypothetical protein
VQKAQLGEIGGSGGRYQWGGGDQGRVGALGGGGRTQGRGRQEQRRTRGGSSGQKATEFRHHCTPEMEVTEIILAKKL